MVEKSEIYACEKCKNIVEVLQAGEGTLVCCGENMKLLEEQTEDQGYEKHVPVVEKTENGIKVKVGDVPHPMEKSHFIKWIEIITDQGVFRKHLEPGQEPEAEFCIQQEDIIAREYCNIHGHWMKK